MDFDSVLSIASQNQGLSSIPKRYSLKTGPPKKDDKIKGVNSTAVQAFLKKQAMEQKKKEQLHKKEKEDLLAKRVELKSDRKARAMASRTKDNFKGYNGIPIVDQPKKRQSKESGSEDQQRSNTCDEDDDYEDNYDYEGTDSDSDEQSKPVGPPPMAKTEFYNKFETKPKKASAPARSAPPSMNFADLLRLAEKKQFEPVELKVAKKTEERLRTAEEIRELEIERRVKKQDKGKDKPQSSSNSQKKTFESDDQHAKVSRSSEEKYQSSKTSQKQMRQASSERLPTSAKHNGDRNNSSSSGAFNNKGAMNNAAKFNGKQAPRPSQSQKPTPSSDLNPRKGSNSLPQVKSGFLGQSPASGAGRPCQAPHKNPGNVKSGHSSNVGPPQKPANHANSSRPVSSGPPQLGSNGPPRPGSNGPPRPGSNGPPRPGSNGPPRPGSNGPPRPGSNGPPRPGSNGPPRPGSNAPSRPGSVRPSLGEPSKQPRPGGSMHGHPIPGSSRPANNGPRKMGGISGTPMNSMGSGPGRPPCTVVSETISTKDFAARPGIGQRPAVPQGPKTVIGPSGHRILVRPGPALPPITSSYKRKYEDEEEYDSEMDDFIDDEGEDQNEISKHIREIFGYDRNKYKDESDYALKFMESTWKDQQKEEARSLRMAVLEDQEEERRELEEMQRKNAKKRK